MDSKSPIPSSSHEEEAAPPSYNDTVITAPTLQPPKYISASSTTEFFAHQIQDQLQYMATQINSLQTQKSLLSHAKDEKILSLLTTEIQNYLSDFAKSGLQRGSLILIPAKAIEDQNAQPSDYDMKNPDEYDMIVRVQDKEVDEYGDGLWFWKDEDMALRLAKYLKPAPDPYAATLPVRKTEIAPSTGRGFWGRKKGSKSREAVVQPGPLPSQSSADRVVMDVNAQNIVFRTENAFGILETQHGWGVVLKLKVVLAQR